MIPLELPTSEVMTRRKEDTKVQLPKGFISKLADAAKMKIKHIHTITEF